LAHFKNAMVVEEASLSTHILIRRSNRQAKQHSNKLLKQVKMSKKKKNSNIIGYITKYSLMLEMLCLKAC
jgi:mRNA-degrading endonuclease toxin of MazEF toxin-antitoxin module